MGTRDPRVDAYIEKAAPFAKPILEQFREVVHEACPEAEETIRWSVPSFSHHGMLCNMAAFKAHCRIVFAKEPLIRGAAEAFGKIEAVDGLPQRKRLLEMVKQAAKLNEVGTRVPKTTQPAKPPATVPPVLEAALRKSKKARARFAELSPSHKREYIEWISDAKKDETRDKRIERTIAQLEEGKSLNWKYQS
jgi:uncharacterized protein YdeI (YjbR/CyaY-like superfamily)